MIEFWYTVYIGNVQICRYSHREDAIAHVERLRKEGHTRARLVEEAGDDMFEGI